MPSPQNTNQTDPAHVSSGYMAQKKVILELDVNGERIRLANVEDLSLSYTVATEDVVLLGSTITQHFPTHASIEGSMTIHTTHGLWLDLVSQHSRLGCMPSVNFRVTQPPEKILTPSNASSARTTSELGDFGFTLYNLVFTSLPLVELSASSGSLALKSGVTFVANGIQINNNLKGNEFLANLLSQ